ncbi:hypothetical protein, partial [Corynebacterium stationis]|uniref:hypothetical protein n=1 Tax=Corynebacterium stationis TaxID=1705 RepID=UPI0026389C41
VGECPKCCFSFPLVQRFPSSNSYYYQLALRDAYKRSEEARHSLYALKNLLEEGNERGFDFAKWHDIIGVLAALREESSQIIDAVLEAAVVDRSLSKRKIQLQLGVSNTYIDNAIRRREQDS